MHTRPASHAESTARVKDLQRQLEDADARRARLEKSFVEPLQAQLDKAVEQMNSAIRERAVVAQQLQAASTAVATRDTKITELRGELKRAGEAAAAQEAARDQAREALAAAGQRHAEEAAAARQEAAAAKRDLAAMRAEGDARREHGMLEEQVRRRFAARWWVGGCAACAA